MRRIVRGACLVLLAAASAGAQVARAEPVHARWASEFVDSVGVNTHFADPTTGYTQHLTLLVQRLHAAHLRHLRDGGLDNSGRISALDNAAAFRALGQAGLRVDFIIRAGVTPGFVRDFPARVAPALEALEMPNEANARATGLAWATGLRAWAARFHALVAACAGCRFPIIGPALTVMGLDNPYAVLGDVSADVDFGNVHDYTGDREPGTRGWGGSGLPPCQHTRYGSLGFAMCYAQAAFPGRRLVSTETGWGTDARRSGNLPEAVQAAYVLRTVLRHFAAGFARTYLYQLMDAGTDEFVGYGLLRADGSPKPAFAALGTLLAALDGPPGHGDAGRGEISVHAADGEEVARLLLRRADGGRVLVLWQEAALTDPDAGDARITVAPRRVTLRVNGDLDRVSACAINTTACAPVGPALSIDADRIVLTVDAEAPVLVDLPAGEAEDAREHRH